MGVIWLLSMAIIFHAAQNTSAWPGENISKPKIAVDDKGLNENKTLNTTNSSILKKVIVNSTEDRNMEKIIMREKRGTELNENDIEKRQPAKNKFSSWAGKRNYFPEEKRSKFSSWGGKRSNGFENNEYDDEMQEEKRAKFSSWGGKRDDNEDEKRAKFSSWAGKRESDQLSEDKRSKFNSWAGKRMDLGDNKRAKFSSWAGKRARFNSWAGKRSDVPPLVDDKLGLGVWSEKSDYLVEPDSEDEKSRFSNWPSKRAPDYIGIAWNRNIPENRLRYYSNGDESGTENIMKLWKNLMSRKRARFSSWAGKRSYDSFFDNENNKKFFEPEVDDQQARCPTSNEQKDETNTNNYARQPNKKNNDSTEDFYNERGYPGTIVKRSIFPWDSSSLAYKRKPIFSSWGGKRSNNIHTIQARSLPMQRVLINGVKDKAWGSLLRPIRRGPDFYAWGGKRSA